MDLTKDQKGAVGAVSKWHASAGEGSLFVLAGYAGTGKTSSVKALVDRVGLDREEVLYAAPTGRAAMILQSKGAKDARTVASAFYEPYDTDDNESRALHWAQALFPKRALSFSRIATPDLLAEIIKAAEALPPDEFKRISNDYEVPPPVKTVEGYTVRFTKRFFLKGQDRLRLMVIDEASMLNDRQIEDVLSFGVPVLFVGDPFQLPPVAGDNKLMLRKPDWTLTETLRQKEGGPILDAAHLIRTKHRTPPMGETDGFARMSERDFMEQGGLQTLKDADHTICGYNRTVRDLNGMIREARGFSGVYPNPGEKVLCTKNHHQSGLVNGLIGTVEKVGPPNARDGGFNLDALWDDGVSRRNVRADASQFDPQVSDVVWYKTLQRHAQIRFGHAATCHRSQGGGWPSVVVYEQPVGRGIDRWRWLYTAYTRAASSLVCVVP